MTTSGPDQLRDHILNDRFDEAARAVNERYRLASGEIMGVFERLMTALSQPSFVNDLRHLRTYLRLGRPSPRSNLRAFLGDTRNQNCLTAVIRNLEKAVPAGVRMGFSNVTDFIGKTDYAGTYRSDIVDYQPDFCRLTDTRLVPLLSSPPNTVDLSLFDAGATEKKTEVTESFQCESLAPVKDIFLTVLEKCDVFFATLEAFALDFGRFFDHFESSRFLTGDRITAEWQALGDDYFHLEVAKSSLMLPISPRALYWGMQKEYPRTLMRLRELRDIVTPDIEISDPESDGHGQAISIICRNPGSVREDSYTLEPTFHFLPVGMETGVTFETAIDVVAPNRAYRFRFARKESGDAPLSLTVKVCCEAKYYSLPFVKEKNFQLP